MTFTGDGKHLALINAENQLEFFTTQPLQRIAPPIPLEGTFVTLNAIGDHEILLTGKEHATQRWSIATQWEFESVLGPDLPGIISDRVDDQCYRRRNIQDDSQF